jgi:hypothetical protein
MRIERLATMNITVRRNLQRTLSIEQKTRYYNGRMQR